MQSDHLNRTRALPLGRILLTLLSPAFLLLASMPALGQAQGTVRGIVVTEVGSPVSGATVRAGDSGPAVLTDASGLFTLKVPPKKYDIVVSKKGFQVERIPGVAVEAGKAKDISALLRPGK